MGLSIIGAGFGRTGTASLKIALEKLGLGPCYHMSEVVARPDHVQRWHQAAEENVDWDGLYDGFHAAVDFPTALYWQELADHFSSAKVILSTRDPERWYASTQETILSPEWWSFAQKGPFGSMCAATIGRYFDGKIHDKDHVIARYREHVEAVQQSIPEDRLLVFQARQGWIRCVRFWGCRSPTGRFPTPTRKPKPKPCFGTSWHLPPTLRSVRQVSTNGHPRSRHLGTSPARSQRL